MNSNASAMGTPSSERNIRAAENCARGDIICFARNPVTEAGERRKIVGGRFMISRFRDFANARFAAPRCSFKSRNREIAKSRNGWEDDSFPVVHFLQELIDGEEPLLAVAVAPEDGVIPALHSDWRIGFFSDSQPAARNQL